MKDFLGQELNIDDIVIVASPMSRSGASFTIAKITGFRKESADVDFITSETLKQINPKAKYVETTSYKRCDKLIKINPNEFGLNNLVFYNEFLELAKSLNVNNHKQRNEVIDYYFNETGDKINVRILNADDIEIDDAILCTNLENMGSSISFTLNGAQYNHIFRDKTTLLWYDITVDADDIEIFKNNLSIK